MKRSHHVAVTRSDGTVVDPSAPLTVACELHSSASHAWIVCIHTSAIRSARRVENEPVAGEAICDACRAGIDAKSAEARANLRLACEGCVKERWPLEHAS